MKKQSDTDNLLSIISRKQETLKSSSLGYSDIKYNPTEKAFLTSPQNMQLIFDITRPKRTEIYSKIRVLNAGLVKSVKEVGEAPFDSIILVFSDRRYVSFN